MTYALNQRSPTSGPWTTDGPRENLGGPRKNLNLTCNIILLMFQLARVVV